MPFSYSSPTHATVRLLTGVSEEVEDFLPTALDVVITDVLTLAEAELWGIVGATAYESSSLAASTVTLMQMFAAYKTGEMIYARFGGVVGQDAQHEIMIRPEQMTEARIYCARRARQMHLILLGSDYLTRAKLEPVA
jgi:hypothetical protein